MFNLHDKMNCGYLLSENVAILKVHRSVLRGVLLRTQRQSQAAVKHSKRRNSHKTQTKIRRRLVVTVAYVSTHADVDADGAKGKQKN